MQIQQIYWISETWRVFQSNFFWMSWNMFLALMPLVISIWLFRRSHRYLWWILLLLTATFLPKAPLVFNFLFSVIHNYKTNYFLWGGIVFLIGLGLWFWRDNRSRFLHWWLGFVVFMAFLPNAPYVLTDIIHLIDDIRAGYSVWVITLVVVPLYLLFILGGFEAYVISLINMGYYLHQQGQGKYIIWAELITHALCAIGIYLGRFLRFNSWDLITQPEVLVNTVDELLNKWPLLVMAITFVVLAGLYWIMKQVTLGIIWYRKNIREATRTAKTDSSIA